MQPGPKPIHAITVAITIVVAFGGCNTVGGLGPLSDAPVDAASDQQVPIGGNSDRLVVLRTTISSEAASNSLANQQALDLEFELIVIDLQTGETERTPIDIDDSIRPASGGDFAAWVTRDDDSGEPSVVVMNLSTNQTQRFELNTLDPGVQVLDLYAVDQHRVVLAGGSTQPNSLIVLNHESQKVDVFENVGPVAAAVLCGERFYFFDAQGFSIPPVDDFDSPPPPAAPTTNLIEFDLLTGQRRTRLTDLGEVSLQRMRVDGDRLLWLTSEFGDGGGSTTSLTAYDLQSGTLETLLSIESSPSDVTDALDSIEDFSTLGVIITAQSSAGLLGVEFVTRFVDIDGGEFELFRRRVGLGGLDALHEPFPRIFDGTIVWRDPTTGDWQRENLNSQQRGRSGT